MLTVPRRPHVPSGEQVWSSAATLGPWASSPLHSGVFGALPLVRYRRENTFSSEVAVGPLSLRVASPGSESPSSPGLF